MRDSEGNLLRVRLAGAVAFIVLAAFAVPQFSHPDRDSYLGWPLLHSTRRSLFRPWAAAADLAVGAAMFASVYCQMSRLGRRRWQIGVADLLALSAVVAILYGLGRVKYLRLDDWIEAWTAVSINLSISPFYKLYDQPWFIRFPIQVGLGTTIYTAGWLCLLALRGIARPKTRPVGNDHER